MKSLLSENEKEQVTAQHLNSKCKISALCALEWHVHTYASEAWNLALKLCSDGKINSYKAGTLLVSKWRQTCDSSLQSHPGTEEVKAWIPQIQDFLDNLVKLSLPGKVKQKLAMHLRSLSSLSSLWEAPVLCTGQKEVEM